MWIEGVEIDSTSMTFDDYGNDLELLASFLQVKE